LSTYYNTKCSTFIAAFYATQLPTKYIAIETADVTTDRTSNYTAVRATLCYPHNTANKTANYTAIYTANASAFLYPIDTTDYAAIHSTNHEALWSTVCRPIRPTKQATNSATKWPAYVKSFASAIFKSYFTALK
jgi:hypothetical protein